MSSVRAAGALFDRAALGLRRSPVASTPQMVIAADDIASALVHAAAAVDGWRWHLAAGDRPVDGACGERLGRLIGDLLECAQSAREAQQALFETDRRAHTPVAVKTESARVGHGQGVA